MPPAPILDFAIEELDRLATATALVGALYRQLEHAASDGALARTLGARVQLNRELAIRIAGVYSRLSRHRSVLHDPDVRRIVIQAEHALDSPRGHDRDLQLALAVETLDEWHLALYARIATMLSGIGRTQQAAELDLSAGQLDAFRTQLRDLAIADRLAPMAQQVQRTANRAPTHPFSL